jgi:hypothetical protein
MAKHTTSRSRLVSGCGTILKTDRLTGGYKLVKRKRTAKESTPATGKKRGRPAKAKMTASAPVSAPAKRRGRPAKAKMTASAPMSAPAKRRGRPAKAKMTASAPVMATKRKAGRPKGSTNKRKTRRRAKTTA